MARLVATVVSTTIYLMIFGVVVAFSGAPPRVHAVNALGLLLAFWIPAQFVTRPEMLRSHLRVVLPFILVGTLQWDVLSAVVISKRDFFWGAIVL